MYPLAFLVLAAIGVWLSSGGKEDVSHDGNVGRRVRSSRRSEPRTRNPEPRGSGKRLKKGKKDELASGKERDGHHVRRRTRRNLGRERDGAAPEDSRVVEPPRDHIEPPPAPEPEAEETPK